jgi:hypothetical protein
MGVLLAACGDSEERPSLPKTTPTITLSADPTLEPQRRRELEDYQVQLRVVHRTLSDIWEGLEQANTAQCGQTYAIPSPSIFDPNAPIEGELGQAAANLRQASDLWSAECELRRFTVPPEVIEEGLRWVRSAGDALARAESALANQP